LYRLNFKISILIILTYINIKRLTNQYIKTIRFKNILTSLEVESSNIALYVGGLIIFIEMYVQF